MKLSTFAALCVTVAIAYDEDKTGLDYARLILRGFTFGQLVDLRTMVLRGKQKGGWHP